MKIAGFAAAAMFLLFFTACGGGGESGGGGIYGGGKPDTETSPKGDGVSGGVKLDTEASPKGGGTVSRDIGQIVYPAGTSVTPGTAAVGNMKLTEVLEETDDLAMVSVSGGTFTMGCTPEQGNYCYSHERPVHSVTVGNFQIGKYVVTRRL